MKNNLLKYYIAALYFGSTFVMFADPGAESENADLENVDPTMPINSYIAVLIIIGLVYVFFKLRSFALLEKNMPKQ